MNEVWDKIISKLLQYCVSVFGGLLLAIETSFDFFIPCLIAVILDVISAYALGRRVHKKHPKKSDGKFKSEYKNRIMITMLIVWACVICAHYVDNTVRCEDDHLAVRFVVGTFLLYEAWSILENWSSENRSKWAKVLQRIMVNKAERHLNIELSDLLLEDETKKEEENAEQRTD